MRPSGRNPCKSVHHFKVQRQKERFLTLEELTRLGRVLDCAPADRLESRHSAAAIRLLILTGCLRNEILTLRWEDVDLGSGNLRLPDAKTGARSVALSPSARSVLEGVAAAKRL